MARVKKQVGTRYFAPLAGGEEMVVRDGF